MALKTPLAFILRGFCSGSPLKARGTRFIGQTTNPNEVQKHLKDSASFDESLSEEQSVWPSSSYHGSTPSTSSSTKQQAADPAFEPVELEPGAQDDSRNTILLFPGQGSQFVGMGKSLEDLPAVKDLYDSASHILGYNLRSLSLNGPREKLDRTKYCQPAMVVASLASVERLYHNDPSLVKNCIAVAGFSVGEITALIFSGAISFEDGLRLVQARGEAMELASEMEPSGMMTIFYGRDHNIGLGCEVARKWIKKNHGIREPVCQIANYLFAGAKVLAGHEEALKFIEENKGDFGIRKTKRIPVSGAFHTPLMTPAVEPFKEALSLVRVRPPRIPVYSNVSGEPYKHINEISKLLPKQIVKAVKWEQCVKKIYEKNFSRKVPNDAVLYPQTIECGPGNALTSMLQKLNGKAYKKSMKVDV